MNDLSQVEITSAKELSGLVLQPWEWKMHGAPQSGRGKEEGTESGPTDETDNGPDGQESPTDSGDSHATSSVSSSKEEWGTDRWGVGSESSCEEEITEEPMDEEGSLDAESARSATTDTTLGSVTPSSQEARQLEDPLDLGHPAGGVGGQNQPLRSVKDLILQWWVGMPPPWHIRSKGKASWNPYPSAIPHKQS